jgi:hypothetical protein
MGALNFNELNYINMAKKIKKGVEHPNKVTTMSYVFDKLNDISD